LENWRAEQVHFGRGELSPVRQGRCCEKVLGEWVQCKKTCTNVSIAKMILLKLLQESGEDGKNRNGWGEAFMHNICF
jgi:hypothetical protein